MGCLVQVGSVQCAGGYTPRRSRAGRAGYRRASPVDRSPWPVLRVPVSVLSAGKLLENFTKILSKNSEFFTLIYRDKLDAIKGEKENNNW